MTNNPFLPPSFSMTVPATKPGGGWNTFTGPQEDGPSIFANSGAIRYNGLDQTKTINAAPTNPTKNTFPAKAVGMSQIFFQPTT